MTGNRKEFLIQLCSSLPGNIFQARVLYCPYAPKKFSLFFLLFPCYFGYNLHCVTFSQDKLAGDNRPVNLEFSSSSTSQYICTNPPIRFSISKYPALICKHILHRLCVMHGEVYSERLQSFAIPSVLRIYVLYQKSKFVSVFTETKLQSKRAQVSVCP